MGAGGEGRKGFSFDRVDRRGYRADMMPRRFFLTVAAALWPGGLVFADPANPPQLAPSRLADSLDAVARIRGASADRGGCSAVLIAPDRALTAAHCARGPLTGPNRMTLTFRPGAPEPLLRRAVRAARLHPEASRLTAATAHADLALLFVDHAVPLDLVAPIPLADPATPSATGAIFGYLNPDRDLLHGHEACQLVPLDGGLIGSDCRVVSGLSGAPALSGGPGTWRVEGITVATISAAPLRALIADVVPWQDAIGPLR